MAAKKPSAAAGRREARIAAVQALYQLDMNEPEPRQVIAEFVTHRLPETADRALFGELVAGVADRIAEIDEAVAGTLVEGWSLERLEMVLRAILRAGAFELMARADVPARVVISEYVDIAHAFFAGKEPGLVNGVLDKLARVLRAPEFGAARG